MAYTENIAGSCGKSGRSILGDGVFCEFDFCSGREKDKKGWEGKGLVLGHHLPFFFFFFKEAFETAIV